MQTVPMETTHRNLVMNFAPKLPALAIALVLNAMAPTAQAMTEKDAANNVFFFAVAMKEAELCEKLGYPSMESVRRWENIHADVLVQSLRRIEQYAVESKKVDAEGARDVALGFFVRSKDRFDREIAPTLGHKTCAKFNEALQRYQSKFVTQ